MDRLFIFLLCFYFVAAKIKINRVNVPQSIEGGTVNEVFLDCDYDAGNEPGVEVKWYYNGTHNQIYQWIPETQKPGQASGPFKELIDTTYKISNDKGTTLYSSLHIMDVTPELSGNYTCKVSGFHSEDQVTRSMIIYDAADDELDLTVVESDAVALCNAGGLYPQPNMTLYIVNLNNSEIILQQDEEMTELDDNGLYNVTAALYFDSLNLTGAFQYVCELSIPDTDYELQKKTVHYLETPFEEIDVLLWMDYFEFFDNVTADVGNSTGDKSEAKLGNDNDDDDNERFEEEDEKRNKAGSSARYHSNVFVMATLLLMTTVSRTFQS